jgi:hypothetical protein
MKKEFKGPFVVSTGSSDAPLEYGGTVKFGKETPVTITMNGVERNFKSAAEALTDEAFGELSENCGYNDTGGGWRDTYRRRYTAMIKAFSIKGKPVIDSSESPLLAIRRTTIRARNKNITRLVTKKGLVEFNDNRYGSQISKINELVEDAKADFPSLKDNEIEVVLFDGHSKKGIFGLHFKVPTNDEIPSDYMLVDRRERIQ